MSLRIGLMPRNVDERGGAAVYTRSVLDALLRIDQDNEDVPTFAKEADRQRYGRPRARNIVVEPPSKVVWDQMAAPRSLVREQVDVAFSLKHSIPLYSFAPRVFIMHRADWIAFPEDYSPKILPRSPSHRPSSCRDDHHPPQVSGKGRLWRQPRGCLDG